jgi:PAS domain S-box-containing protein
MATTEMMQISALKRSLSFLILGQKGGKNRIQIIDLLRDRPYNINQIAEILELNYRTVKHHIDLLLKHEIISSSKTGGYGDVFFLSPELEGNIQLYEEIVKKMDVSKQLKDFTDSPRFFKNILQKTYDAVIIVDHDWDVFFWNTSAQRMFGYKKTEIIYGPLNIFQDDDSFNEIKKRISKKKRLNDFETTAINKSGNPLHVNLTADPILNKDKKTIGCSILARDITIKRRADIELKTQMDMLEIIMENTGASIAYLDPDFIFINVNSAYAKGTGYNKKELIGKNYFSIFPNKNNKDIFQKVLKTGKAIEVFDKPYEFVDQPDRGVTYWNWTLIPVKNDDGKVVSLVLSLMETTGHVRASDDK